MSGVPGVKGSEETSLSKNKWVDLKPKSIGFENAMGAEQVAEVWKKIYVAVGGASDETKKSAVRLAVYTYAMINGTSREGAYRALCKTSYGTTFPASVISQSTGRMEIRRFFRGNMTESYEALKASDVATDYPDFVASAATKGISADCAFATADWLTDCYLLTPAEERAHNVSFTISVEKSRRARGGHRLEEVEADRISDSLAAQGPMASGGPIEM
jgi:hypothetical protein